MADMITESTAKLQLDEETGEMVSKNELKKRLQKRAKKAATAASRGQHSINTPSTSSRGVKADEFNIDPDAMFNQGFLAEVYRQPATRRFTGTRQGSRASPKRRHQNLECLSVAIAPGANASYCLS